MRKCIVKDKEAYFHKWIEESKLILDGSNNNKIEGQAKATLGLIEYIEDGTVHKCYPEEVRFIKERSYDILHMGDGRTLKKYKGKESESTEPIEFKKEETPKEQVIMVQPRKDMGTFSKKETYIARASKEGAYEIIDDYGLINQLSIMELINNFIEA